MALIRRYFGAARFIYNEGLRLKIDRYQNFGENLSWIEIDKMVTFWKKTEERAWMKIPARSVYQHSLQNLEKAYKNFFAGRSKFPRFKKRNDTQSFVLSDPSRIINGTHIKLPKLGLIRIRGLRNFSGDIKNVTITMNRAGEVYATFGVDLVVKTQAPKKPKKSKKLKVVGIDVNLENFLTDSDGNRVENPRFKKQVFNKIKYYQRRASKCVPKSKRKDRWRLKVAREFQKVSNKKSDFLHKLSHNYVKNHDVIKVEDLRIKNMVKNHKLAEAISNVAWGEFFRQLEYKCEIYGKTFEKVDPRNTSKACNKCGELNIELTLKDREWTCANCGAIHVRDENSAKNIKNKKGKGIALKAIGGTDNGRAVEFGKRRKVA